MRLHAYRFVKSFGEKALSNGRQLGQSFTDIGSVVATDMSMFYSYLTGSTRQDNEKDN